LEYLEPVGLALGTYLKTELSQLEKRHRLPIIEWSLDGGKLCVQIGRLKYLLGFTFVVCVSISTDSIRMQLDDLGAPKQNTDDVLVTHVAVTMLLSCNSPLVAERHQVGET